MLVEKLLGFPVLLHTMAYGFRQVLQVINGVLQQNTQLRKKGCLVLVLNQNIFFGNEIFFAQATLAKRQPYVQANIPH